MDARSVLSKLRQGVAPPLAELAWFAQEIAAGGVDDGQIGAFAMGLCHTPLGPEGRAALTIAMRDSGETLRWDLPGPAVDKHSTGGVGDPISLILGPAMASLGAYMPMLSGRGLGHTGGTLDKLEAIPGIRTDLPIAEFQRIVRDAGWGIAAAGPEIAPADKRLYAVRDVTATVESLDLITASILSKKLAGGVGPLILDVKLGSGAFNTTLTEAEALADALVGTANAAGGPAGALITDMNQPCVSSLGNALEIMEVMRLLTDPGLRLAEQITAELGGALLMLAGLADTPSEGAVQIAEAVASGAAAERFGRMIASMGGPTDFVERWRDRLPAAPVVREIVAPVSGFVAGIDGRALGMGVIRLGGGRLRAKDRIDPAVGLSDVVMLGDPIEAGEPLAIVHGRSESATEAIALELSQSFTITQDPITPPELVHKAVL